MKARKSKGKGKSKGRNIKRTVLVILLCSAVAFASILVFGGKGIRWFGAKGEEASETLGETIKDKSCKLGDKADKMKEHVEEKATDIKKDIGKRLQGNE